MQPEVNASSEHSRFPAKFLKKISLFSLFIILVAAAVLIYKQANNSSPVPAEIKKQLSSPAVYPKKTADNFIDTSSFKYDVSTKTLSFSAKAGGVNLLLSEQRAPGSSPDDSLVYYQSLGLKPITQIRTKLGQAVLVNFYSSDTLDSKGKNAILQTNGTLLIIHPDKDLSDEQWKTILNSLKITK